MGFVLKIIAVVFSTLLLLGVIVNNLIYPFNIIGFIGVLAYSTHMVQTVIKNKNV